eukprot:925005-Lingulodinium_polyedra.AAC.1
MGQFVLRAALKFVRIVNECKSDRTHICLPVSWPPGQSWRRNGIRRARQVFGGRGQLPTTIASLV